MIFNWTSASNSVRTATTSSLTALTTDTTSCGASVASQIISVKDCDVVSIGDVSQKQLVSISQTCMTSADTDQKVKNSVEKAYTQAAEAVTQGLSALDATVSKNAVDSVTNLATSVTSAMLTNCPDAIAEQGITVANCKTATIKGVQQDQIASMVQKCTSDFKATQDATNTVLETIDQKAKAEQLGLFGGLGGIIALIAIVVIVIVIGKGGGGSAGGAGKGVKIAAVVCVVLVLLAIVLVVFYFLQFWPYATVLATDSEYAAKKKRNLIVVLVSAGVGALAAAGLALAIYVMMRKGATASVAAAATAGAAAAAASTT